MPITRANPPTIFTAHNMFLPVPSNTTSPARLACKNSILQLCSRTRERYRAIQRNMINPPIPNPRINHPITAKRHDRANDRASQTIIPIMILIDRQRTRDQRSAENRGVGGDEFPHRRMVVGPYLQLGVQVQVQEHEACEGSSGVARWEGLEGVVDFILVAGADFAVVHYLAEAVACFLGCDFGDVGLADCEEVGSKTADEPF
jgi:hypothetical protein